MSVIGASYARQKAQYRKQFGADVTLAGKPCRGVAREMQDGEREFLPEGTRNAGAAEVRVIEFTPGDLPASVAPGTAGQPMLEGGQGYTVIAVPQPLRKQNVPHTQIVMCFRTPPTAAESQSSAQLAAWTEREVNP